jgi:dCMP deaminase
MRPCKNLYFMCLADLASTRATCLKRAVGCVLVDQRGHVLSMGYNGVSSGMPHCNEENPCHNWDLPPGQDSCEAVHAEQNALLQCRDPWSIDTAYVTLSPCKACLKLLMNTSCQRIVFRAEHSDPWPKAQWEKMGRTWVHLDDVL